MQYYFFLLTAAFELYELIFPNLRMPITELSPNYRMIKKSHDQYHKCTY